MTKPADSTPEEPRRRRPRGPSRPITETIAKGLDQFLRVAMTKGVPATDPATGAPLLDAEGNQVYRAPSAALLNVARQRCKDKGEAKSSRWTNEMLQVPELTQAYLVEKYMEKMRTEPVFREKEEKRAHQREDDDDSLQFPRERAG